MQQSEPAPSSTAQVERTADASEDVAAAPLVVGVGASAGGLRALETLFTSMPADSQYAFVVIQHLSPHYPSHMDELLARKTRLKIRKVEDGDQIAPGTIYLLPPKKEMTIAKNRLWLSDKNDRALALPINRFLESLAVERRNQAIGIILSGTGSDGTHGCRRIRAAGGLVICQSEASAEFPSMPQNVERNGLADLSLPPEQMPEALARFAKDNQSRELRERADPQSDDSLSDLEKLFALLVEHYDIDFKRYKTGTFGRRVQRRLLLTGASDLQEYLELLRRSKKEADTLYRDLLVNVTEFFRDTDSFAYLRNHVVPAIVAQAEPEIRVWSCGCATGEEAYSLAILFLEEIQKQNAQATLKVFATDAHASSLEFAGMGVYNALSVESVSKRLLDKYFTRNGDCWTIKPEVRRCIVFAQHNVLAAAPFTRMDLVVCRNLLIYLQAEAQQRALALFHFALKKGGRLFLGRSESVGRFANDLRTESAAHKVFVKATDKRLNIPGQLSFSDLQSKSVKPVPRQIPPAANPRDLSRIYDKLLARYMPASVLVNHDFDIVHAFPGSETYLRVRLGRPSHRITDVVDPEIAPQLSQALIQATKKSAIVQFIHKPDDSQVEGITIAVEPIYAPGSRVRDFLIRFEPPRKTLASPDSEQSQIEELQLDAKARNIIAELQEELDDAKENLQATIEELETSNEELQASNEELVASNEELQSSNEELHSVNEEIFTVNSEYQKKIDELTELTDDMGNLLVSTEVGVIFLDAEMRIRRFTPQITKIFDLEDSDLGRAISSFSHKIDYDDLAIDLERCLKENLRIERETRSKDGTAYFVRLLPYKTKIATEGVVITVIDVNSLVEAEKQIRKLSAIVENSIDAIISIDLHGVITSWNHAAELLYGFSREQALGQKITELVIPESERHQHAALVKSIIAGREVETFETQRKTADGQLIPVSIQFSPIYEGRTIIGVSSIVRDISAHKEAIRKLEESERSQRKVASVLENVLASMPDLIVVFRENLEIEYASPAAQAFIERFATDGELPLQLQDDVEQVISTGQDYLPIDHRGVRTLEIGSQLRHFLPRVKAMRNPSGDIYGAVAILQDITDLRFLDEMKSNLLATVSHELKTPAVSIRLSLGMLKDTGFGTLTDTQLQLVDTSQREIERLIRNLATLLDITRFEEGRAKLSYSTINPEQLSQLVVEETRHAAQAANVQVETRLNSRSSDIRIDRERMVIVITNLVLNAIKYSPTRETVELIFEQDDQHLTVIVKDRGPGIPEAYRERVFERFFRVPGQKSKSGTGLGLSIVQSFVDAHHGEVTVSENKPTGTIFTLRIPVTPTRSTTDAPPDA